MSATVMLFDPTAPQVAATATGSVQLTSLAGAVIGFIDNAKPNFHHLVDDMITVKLGKEFLDHGGDRDIIVHAVDAILVMLHIKGNTGITLVTVFMFQ